MEALGAPHMVVSDEEVAVVEEAAVVSDEEEVVVEDGARMIDLEVVEEGEVEEVSAVDVEVALRVRKSTEELQSLQGRRSHLVKEYMMQLIALNRKDGNDNNK